MDGKLICPCIKVRFPLPRGGTLHINRQGGQDLKKFTPKKIPEYFLPKILHLKNTPSPPVAVLAEYPAWVPLMGGQFGSGWKRMGSGQVLAASQTRKLSQGVPQHLHYYTECDHHFKIS